MILGREVVAWTALVRAAVVLITTFGLHLAPEQIGAIYLFAEVALSFIARQNVTPTAAPVLKTGTEVTTPSGTPAIVTAASPNR